MNDRVINLRTIRKRKARTAARAAADAQAVKHGRTRAERAAAAAERNRLDSHLDGVKRSPPTSVDGGSDVD